MASSVYNRRRRHVRRIERDTARRRVRHTARALLRDGRFADLPEAPIGARVRPNLVRGPVK